MEKLLIDSSFPKLSNDITIAKAQIDVYEKMPPTEGLSASVVHDMNMWYVLHLMRNNRPSEAVQVIDSMVYNDDEPMSYVHLSWLWLARMSLFIDTEDYMLALGAAETSLTELSKMPTRKGEDSLALVAGVLYNLAYVHNAMGDNSRASKELVQAQKLYERLVKKNEARFSAMLLYSVEASTQIFKSKLKQMNVFEHYQKETDDYTAMLNRSSGDAENTREALSHLVDSLKNEGDIMLEMGNGRNAVKYYTKALRYQKKLSSTMGEKELVLSIGLAKALMKLINRRAAAEQLLKSLQPLAQRLDATNEMIEIENLLNNKNKNGNIMTLLKSIFMVAIVVLSSLTVMAGNPLIVGHRGSIWGVENTDAAFVNGARSGAWGLECDIHATSDGAWVICHDSYTKRIGGNDVPLGKMTIGEALSIPLTQTRTSPYYEGSATYTGHLMTLGAYIDLCNEQNVVPVIEVKSSECFNLHGDPDPAKCNYSGLEALRGLLESKGVLHKAVIISFMPQLIEHIHNVYPDMQVQVLVGGKAEEAEAISKRWLEWCVERRIDLDIYYELVTPELVRGLHDAGLKVNVWTVDDPVAVEAMCALDVDYITTNVAFPTPVMPLIKKQR